MLTVWIRKVWIRSVSICGGSVVDCRYKVWARAGIPAEKWGENNSGRSQDRCSKFGSLEVASDWIGFSLASGLDSSGGNVRYCFRFWNVFSHSSSHLSLCTLLITLMNGLHRPANSERKRLTAATRSVRLWISFRVMGDFTSRIALIFLGWASIPCWVTRYPKSQPKEMRYPQRMS